MQTEFKNNQEQLPFDPRTILVSLKKYRKTFLIIILGSCVAGVLAGLILGERTYQSETVLLFKPRASITGETREIPSVKTQMNMVKLHTNLSEVRHLLKLDSTLQVIGAAANIKIQRDTDLMIISAKWDKADIAQKFTNTLTAVFLNRQRMIRHQEIAQYIKDVEKRRLLTMEKLKRADNGLQEFTSENNLINLDKQAQWFLEELTNLSIQYEQAKIEKTTIDMQNESIDNIIHKLKLRLSEEKNSSSATETLSELSLRFRRLRDVIHDDKLQRAQQADLVAYESEYQRAVKMHEKQLISEMEFQRIKSSYERQKALSVDTDQIKKWKEELKKIDETLIPDSNKDETMSARLLQEMMLRAFDVELNSVALTEKVDSFAAAIERVNKKLNDIPRLSQRLSELQREVTVYETEKLEMDELLRKARNTLELELSDYMVVSPALLPIYPINSSRKPLAFIVAVMLSMFGCLTIIIYELFATNIRSAAELKLRTGLPVLATLPLLTEPGQDPQASQRLMDDEIRFLVQLLAQEMSHKGYRLLITGSERGEGVSTLSLALASTYSRQGKSVLIMDQLTAPADEIMIPAHTDNVVSLKNNQDEKQGFRFIKTDSLVTRLSRAEDTLSPDHFNTVEFADFMQQLSAEYDVILIETPPAQSSSDAQLLAQYADAVICIARSQFTSWSSIRQITKRFSACNIKFTGAVLNAVPVDYRDAA